MADEKNRNLNQGDERNEKAMGATATTGAQPDQKGLSGKQRQPEQGESGQQNFGRGQREAAGQGGGIQGQGQRNPNPGQDKGGEDYRPTGGGARQGDGDV